MVGFNNNLKTLAKFEKNLKLKVQTSTWKTSVTLKNISLS